MDTTAAASFLGITTSTVRNQIQKGVLTATRAGTTWDISETEVARYLRDHLGNRHRIWAPGAEPKRLEALRSPETRAKMRAAKIGRPLSAAHRATLSISQRLRPPPTSETRAKLSTWQKGKPKSPEHVAAMKAAVRPVMTVEHRAKIAAALVRAYEEGRRSYTSAEQYAASLLVPLGFDRNPILDGHAFDFGRGDLLVEVNGCYWHDHRAIKPSCPIRMHPQAHPHDELRREIAAAHDRQLLELWQCEKRDWPAILEAHQL